MILSSAPAPLQRREKVAVHGVGPGAALDAVAAACIRLQSHTGRKRGMADVFEEVLPILERFDVFDTMAFVAVDGDGLGFSVGALDQHTDRLELAREIEHHVSNGGFAWSLYQNRPVLAPGQIAGRWTLLHSLGTPARVLGMFMGSLPRDAPPPSELVQTALSIVFMNCSSVLEAGLLQGELAEHTTRLEKTVAERTSELRESESAAHAANEAKTVFLANMSHEIRTPLNGIVGMGSLLAHSTLDMDQREQVQTINRSATSLLDIINDILDMSKVEAGQLSLETVSFDLRDTLEQVVVLLASQAATKRVELCLQYGNATPRRIYGDPVRVRQVVTNLVGNAVKFTDCGQVIVDATVDGRTGAIRISVEDSGIGIPLDRQEKIFDAFTQADSSTTRRFGGSGLGLAISRKIAHLMDGDLHVASTPGVGSTFTLVLRPSMIDHAPTHDFDMRGESVLLVSKRTALITSLSGMITAAGGVMRHVEAPAMVQEEVASLVSADRAPSSVILDAEWGERPFEWMVESVRDSLREVNTQLVALLAPGDRATHEKLMAAGFDHCIPRPVQERRLLSALTRTSDGSPPEPTAPSVFPLARVLVAEDDPANTAVVVMMLERLGCVAHTVSTGQQAVDALADADFDLVLMDCLMPEMDGCTATMEIRAAETGRIPIIAVTASASPTDRQRCSEAGMDEHLAKPFDLSSLSDVVARWVGAPVASAVAACAPPPEDRGPNDAGLPVFDHEAAIARVGGNRRVIEEVLDIFLEGWPGLQSRLVEALSADDLGDLHMVAHRIKSTAGCLEANRLAAAARDAEADWSSHRLDGAAQHVESLRAGFDEFRPEAERFRDAARPA